jgi:hypothetical protein
VRFKLCFISSSIDNYWINNLRSDGALRRKWRPLFGKVGEWYVKSRHLQGCILHLCRLGTDGLASMSKYSTEDGFTPTTSMAGSGEKLFTDPRIDQPLCCGLCRELFFSGAMTLSIAVDNFTKSCYMRTT